MERSYVFSSSLGFQVDMTSVHQSNAVGEAVVALELVFDDGSLDSLGAKDNSGGQRRMALRARSVQKCTPPTASSSSRGDEGKGDLLETRKRKDKWRTPSLCASR